MPERPSSAGLSERDQQIGSLLSVMGPVSRDPDPSSILGYRYQTCPEDHLREASGHLQERHGLDTWEVLDRFVAASELAVIIRQHVAPRLPTDNISHRFN